MASSGPNSPGTAEGDASYGLVPWNDMDWSKTEDDQYASASLLAGGSTTHYLKLSNFGFAVPSDVTIDGIVVEIQRYCEQGVGVTDKAYDSRVRIIKGGTIGSTDKASATLWPLSDSDTYVSYGSSADLWGETWTAADINVSNFGMTISGTREGSGPAGAVTLYIDHIRITVYYTEAAPEPEPEPTPEPPGPAPTAESAEELKYARLPNLRICDLCQNLYPPEELVEEFGYKLCRRHCYMGPKSALVSEWDDLYR